MPTPTPIPALAPVLRELESGRDGPGGGVEVGLLVGRELVLGGVTVSVE